MKRRVAFICSVLVQGFHELDALANESAIHNLAAVRDTYKSHLEKDMIFLEALG